MGQSESMELRVERPTRKQAIVRWREVTGATSYRVTLKDKASIFSFPLYRPTTTQTSIDLSLYISVGHAYSVNVEALMGDGLEIYIHVIQSDIVEFRAVFTKDELEQLRVKAMLYTLSQSSCSGPLKWLYRNKPLEYFDKTYGEDGGIMKVYLKDNNGDAASIINGQISGLFFGTRYELLPDLLPGRSPFGPKRLSLPAEEVFSDPRVRLYFADFYCSRKFHYVSLVLTYAGSETDRFCSEHLLSLDLTDNDFLFKRGGQVMLARGGSIEVLYTEDINMSDWKARGATETIVYSTGTSTPGGLPKKSGCTTCNLP